MRRTTLLAAAIAAFFLPPGPLLYAGATIGSNGATGTVSSVGLTAPANFTVTGSPVTGSGTLGFAWSGLTTSGLLQATGATAVSSTLTPSGLTSINKIALTQPATGSTLTLADGKTFTVSNTLTFTGTDASSVNFGAGGTVLYSGGSYVSSLAGTAGQITASASTGAVTLSLAGPHNYTTLTANGIVIGEGTSPLQVSAASLTSAGALSGVTTLSASGIALFTDSTAATSVSTGAIVDSGGLGVAGNIYGGGNLSISGDLVTNFGGAATNYRLASISSTLSAWGSAGVIENLGNGSIFTDSSTAASGTAALETFYSFAAPTLAASNTGVTTTTAATVYIAGPPTAGTNQTITNPYALDVNSGNTSFGGYVTINASYAYINNPAGTNRTWFYLSSGSARWLVGANSTAESGSNVGSDFQWHAYSDSGVNLGSAMTLTRANGNLSIMGNFSTASPSGGTAEPVTFGNYSSSAGWNLGVNGTARFADAGTTIKKGTATLVAGAATVTDSSVVSGTYIELFDLTPGGTPGALGVATKTAGTGFSIASTSATDTSVVEYVEFTP